VNDHEYAAAAAFAGDSGAAEATSAVERLCATDQLSVSLVGQRLSSGFQKVVGASGSQTENLLTTDHSD
jgi:hypothetical protein